MAFIIGFIFPNITGLLNIYRIVLFKLTSEGVTSLQVTPVAGPARVTVRRTVQRDRSDGAALR